MGKIKKSVTSPTCESILGTLHKIIQTWSLKEAKKINLHLLACPTCFAAHGLFGIIDKVIELHPNAFSDEFRKKLTAERDKRKSKILHEF